MKLIDADALMETIEARGTKSISIPVLQRLVDEAPEAELAKPTVGACDSCIWYNGGGCAYFGQNVAKPEATRCVQYQRRHSK